MESLPYTCDIDVRDFVDFVSIMQQYDLGPNGALIMANDLIASKIDDIQNEVNRVNPDYQIVDTPGQIELFAYRSSGRFLVENISSDEKTSIFLFDGALITTPVNFVSITLLATSIRLRLNLPTVNRPLAQLTQFDQSMQIHSQQDPKLRTSSLFHANIQETSQKTGSVPVIYWD